MIIFETPRVTSLAPFAGAVAWLALVNSIATFTLLYMMLRRFPASRASSLFFLTPSVTAVMAWALVDQPLSPLTVAGLVVSGAGVALATSARPAPDLPGQVSRPSNA